ncbi:MAG: hypothetical protein C4562_01065 [Actinobacteria bacterium]|nr:MAG: hypothetical protein C4562_01065 [Actinomycetota bacterium]
MFFCAQLDANDICFCIGILAEPIEKPNVIQIPEGNDAYLGKKFDRQTETWYGLSVEAQKTAIAAGEELPIAVAWTDENGTVLDVPATVEAICKDKVIPVDMVNGQGILTFSAAESGRYAVEFQAANGCRAILGVTVNG